MEGQAGEGRVAREGKRRTGGDEGLTGGEREGAKAENDADVEMVTKGKGRRESRENRMEDRMEGQAGEGGRVAREGAESGMKDEVVNGKERRRTNVVRGRCGGRRVREDAPTKDVVR
jgi:hypothetical protein